MATLRRLLPLAGVLAAGFLHAAPAAASGTQEAMFQDDIQIKSNPAGTLATLHSLGVNRVRISLNWDHIETRRGQYDFSLYDAIDRAAAANHIAVYFMLTGPAPSWQTGPHPDRGVAAGSWEPSAKGFGAFVHAAGAHFNGRNGVPRVSFWSIWNEPNYGQSISPQTTHHNTVETGAALYRSLVYAAWNNLAATGHTPRHDTILIGETAPRGVNNPGDFLGIKPLSFLRALYCVNGRYQPLRGSAARAIGCPTTNAGSRHFRAANPGLFGASGFADHPYALQSNPGPPNRPTNLTGGRYSDPDFADLPQLPALERTLDRLNSVYGSRSRFPIWNTEYGYRTRPPDRVGVSPSTGAYYINWAEYLSWRMPRLRDYMQYLLIDGYNGVFASGLIYPNGKSKPALDAYRMPLFLPNTATRRGRSLEVWGGVRPAHTASGPQRASIEFRRGAHGKWKVLEYVTIRNVRGYIDTRVKFPASGAVRIGWRAPSRQVYYSRTVNISVR